MRRAFEKSRVRGSTENLTETNVSHRKCAVRGILDSRIVIVENRKGKETTRIQRRIFRMTMSESDTRLSAKFR